MAMLLVDLPPEILELIFGYVARKDVKVLALTCHMYRKRLLPYIMRQLHVTWPQLVELQRSLQDSKEPHTEAQSRFYCETVLIPEPDAYIEYQQNTFGRLLSPEVFPKLRHVCVHSASSSYWLKYNKCSHIRSLSLVNEDVSQSRKIFSLDHLDHFDHLQSLTLHKYHFNWSDADLGNTAKAQITRLFLHDCTWQYPFNLALFNISDSLRTLAITYSHDNSFVLSERFLDFFKDPLPGHSASIRNLEIGFTQYTENKKLLTSTILATLLDAFCGLDSLHLYGWYTTEAYVRVILSKFRFSFPVDIDVELDWSQASESEGTPQKNLRWKRRLYDVKS